MTLQLLLLGDVPVAQLVERARLAEANGYSAVWVADERFYREVYTCLGQIAAHTTKILLGPCVTDPYAPRGQMAFRRSASCGAMATGKNSSPLASCTSQRAPPS
jgi:alkanesulfonate monooxygenase SsuD/methylene tetrahydromethanopterin reductase-like flavin-dependent oxidoreductase (luciferase family)